MLLTFSLKLRSASTIVKEIVMAIAIIIRVIAVPRVIFLPIVFSLILPLKAMV